VSVLRLQKVSALSHSSRVLVTGCAGFIGSHLAERLVAEGHEVIGVDCFTDFYDEALKRENLAVLLEHERFTLLELDLSEDPLSGLLDGVSIVFHLAAQAGVRPSFGDSFADYSRHNVVGTQRLLELATSALELDRFVYASSSSVYGAALSYPTAETAERRPVSPYGMTKVATEELAGVYHRTAAVPVTGLRYFTAYGPRQRPDMAFNRFIRIALAGKPIPVYGTGRQLRDFTYVDDVIDGTLAAAAHGRSGAIYNIGGGQPTELGEVISMIGAQLGGPLNVIHHAAPRGEAAITAADGRLALEELGFEPKTPLYQGLSAQLAWMQAAEKYYPSVLMDERAAGQEAVA
jgi:nucleoside-diphosphate-sugar epimerase